MLQWVHISLIKKVGITQVNIDLEKVAAKTMTILHRVMILKDKILQGVTCHLIHQECNRQVKMLEVEKLDKIRIRIDT